MYLYSHNTYSQSHQVPPAGPGPVVPLRMSDRMLSGPTGFRWTVIILTCQHKDSVYAFQKGEFSGLFLVLSVSSGLLVLSVSSGLLVLSVFWSVSQSWTCVRRGAPWARGPCS